MSLHWLRNSRCYTKYRMKNLYNSYISLQQSCKQHNLWLKPDSTPNYRLNKRRLFNCMLSIMEYSNKLDMRWEMPSSSLNYNSNRHLSFSCMSSIMEYSNKLNKKWLTPSKTRYCIANKGKNCYKVNTVLILLNKQCKQLLKLDSIRNYNLNRRQPFNYMMSIMEYSSKLSMRQKMPSKSHLCMKYKLLSSDCMCCNF